MAITKTFSITGSARRGEYVSDQMFGVSDVSTIGTDLKL
jgi:hypothetical protein